VRVFVTGATGYIGSAVAAELGRSGHHVIGLTRRAAGADALEALGVEPVLADIREAERYRAAARSSDALIHAASEDSDKGPAVDAMAVSALLRAAAGAARVLVYTSGCFILGETGDGPANEDAPIDPAPEAVAWRPAQERRILEAGSPALATSVIRPGMAYGGRRGAFGELFASAEREGAARFVGDGTNRWSPVYRGDAARLYRMVVETVGRGVYHCAERAERVADLAGAASRAAGAGGAIAGTPLERARRERGALADALAMDQVVGCARSRALGWAPEHAPFMESAEKVYAEWAGPGVRRTSGS
jgi:nucleoside-diphosphate-sugar epimerase